MGKKRKGKIKLKGFNNLTKTLSFNIYDVCYAPTPAARKEYLAYIDGEYNSVRLRRIIRDVAETIGATVLDMSTQDYDPMGASVTTLIAEGPLGCPLPAQELAHLDKSHICAHTYPESDKKTGIATFRVDIDVSTCGTVSPLKALNHLITSFESDVLLIDYRVRGFTRDVKGRKVFIDQEIGSIQKYIRKSIMKQYHAVDFNIHQENLFHTKMVLEDFDLDDHVFGADAVELKAKQRRKVSTLLKQEIAEIFYNRTIYPPYKVTGTKPRKKSDKR